MSPRMIRLVWLTLAAVLAMLAIIYAAERNGTYAASCESTRLAVVVNLDNIDNKETIAHARAAVAAGKPRYLHWRPDLATSHRRAALRGIPTAPFKDRDEYPPAATAEGGAGANVRLIDRTDNRSAGARMLAQIGDYCLGQRFILEP